MEKLANEKEGNLSVLLGDCMISGKISKRSRENVRYSCNESINGCVVVEMEHFCSDEAAPISLVWVSVCLGQAEYTI